MYIIVYSICASWWVVNSFRDGSQQDDSLAATLSLSMRLPICTHPTSEPPTVEIYGGNIQLLTSGRDTFQGNLQCMGGFAVGNWKAPRFELSSNFASNADVWKGKGRTKWWLSPKFSVASGVQGRSWITRRQAADGPQGCGTRLEWETRSL